MRDIQKRLTRPFTINSGQSYTDARLGKGGRRQTGINGSRLTRCAHRLH
jgi:hypothetical protein